MNKMQTQVEEFHLAFDILKEDKPTAPDLKTAQLRVALIKEELGELEEALLNKDLIEIADALGDLLYVTFGSAVSFGINIEPIFDEIHRSNMTKVGGYKREDGKWVKPDTYSPAELYPIIRRQC